MQKSLIYIYIFIFFLFPGFKEGPLSVPSFFFMNNIWQDAGIRTRVAATAAMGMLPMIGFPIIYFFLNFRQKKKLDYTSWYSNYAYRLPYNSKNVLNKGVIFSLGILTNKEN